jgi:DNA-binding PadR family transcriptional regulator
MYSDKHRRHHRDPRGGEEDFGFVRMRHGGPGFGGPFGGPFGPRGFGGPGGPWQRKGRRRRGDVRLALLMLLAEEPRNGYQLMQTLEERSGGDWRPSPGSVYPALSQLEDEGFVRGVQSDSGRTFEITDAGREHLAERGEQRPPWEPEEDEPGEAFVAYRRAIFSTAKAAWQVAQDGDEQALAKATELLTETRRGLYRLLAGDAED